MKSSLKYSLQIITDAEQLTEALSLRYRVYKKTYPKLIENCSRPYESDAFDERSIHLGLYCEENGQKKLAGCSRLILPEHYALQFSVLLIQNHPEYINNIANSIKPELAMMERMPESNRKMIDSQCESLKNKNTVYIETSRFIVDEEHRSVSLSFFFLSSMLAIADSLNIGYVFFECQPHHIAFYKRFQFTQLQNIPTFFDSVLDAQQAIFGTDLIAVNEKQTAIKILKKQLETENEITLKRVA
jgi:N-acyl-L-homoserine lactone synthetase